MRKQAIYLALAILLISIQLRAQEKQHALVCVAFYNFENLFDTLDSPHTNDIEFTPGGSNRYDSRVYQEKLDNLARVVSEIGTDLTPDGPALLGVSEVENRDVLEDFVRHERVKGRNYKILHHDSKDGRGIDVALLYQSKYFVPIRDSIVSLMTGFDSDSMPRWSRDVLFVKGSLLGDTVTVSVNHWPSRRGGQAATEGLRMAAARINRKMADTLLIDNPYGRMIIMGDLNDEPTDPSVTDFLYSKGSKKGLKKGQFFNPYVDSYKKGIGTTAYQDAWSLFDQILLSPGFVAHADKGVRFYKAGIYNPRYLVQPLGQYKGYPFRTYGNGVYLGGYSDHFPVYVMLVKEIEN